MGALHLRSALHDVRSILTPANRARIRMALSDHRTREAVVSTRVGMVNELADGAVTNWIEYYLRFATRPRRRRERETGRRVVPVWRGYRSSADDPMHIACLTAPPTSSRLQRV